MERAAKLQIIAPASFKRSVSVAKQVPREFSNSSVILNLLDFSEHGVQSRRHEMMHRFRFGSFHETRLIAITLKEIGQFFFTESSENRWIVDFVTVDMENRQDSSIANRIEKLVGMPARSQWPGFRFAITHHTAR